MTFQIMFSRRIPRRQHPLSLFLSESWCWLSRTETKCLTEGVGFLGGVTEQASASRKEYAWFREANGIRMEMARLWALERLAYVQMRDIKAKCKTL